MRYFVLSLFLALLGLARGNADSDRDRHRGSNQTSSAPQDTGSTTTPTSTAAQATRSNGSGGGGTTTTAPTSRPLADVYLKVPELELVIRLGNLVDVVNRTLASLDLNPLLIILLDTVGDVADDVIGAVDGLLGSIVNGDTKINFLIDNLGDIVQEVTDAGSNALSSIIDNYQQNMTFAGSQTDLGDGLVQKAYEYEP